MAQVEIVAFLSGQLHGARWTPIRILIVMEFVRKSGAPDGGSASGAIGQRSENSWPAPFVTDADSITPRQRSYCRRHEQAICVLVENVHKRTQPDPSPKFH
jgi:hypothetical protein